MISCMLCGDSIKNLEETKKHHMEKHYQYVLAQCYGDVEKVKEWMN